MSQQKEHPDITYLKSPEIGNVISKGLATVYKEQPKNPVQFLANWLLNYSATTEVENSNEIKEKNKIELIAKHKEELEAVEKQLKEKLQQEQTHTNSESGFQKKLENCDDLEDVIQDFVDHIRDNSEATSVYLGHRERVKNAVTDDDNDQAHINPEGKQIIKFLAVDKEHEWLRKKLLEEGQGITFEVWNEPAAEEEQENPEGENEEGVQPEPKEEKLNSVFVPSVVVEPKVHFFEVPRLGSYFAVPITIKTCLNENAFDKAFEERVRLAAEKATMEKDREDKLREIEERREAGEDPEELDKIEIPSIESLVEADFEMTEDHFVLCINTLGQDRGLTEEQRKYIEDWAKNFRENWGRAEREALNRDIDARIARNQADDKYKEEFGETENENENTRIEEEFKDVQEIEDEERDLRTNIAKMDHARTVILNDHFKPQILAFKEEKVIKMGRLLQAVLYFLGYQKEQICEPETNLLHWKTAKKLLNDEFFDRIKKYEPRGPKGGSYPRYAMIPKLEQTLEGFQQEDVDHYSLAFGYLFKWLNLTITARKGDINLRREAIRQKKEVRAKAEEDHKQWEDERNNQLREAIEEAKKEFDDHMAEEAAAAEGEGEGEGEAEEGEKKEPEEFKFDEEAFLENWDKDNPIDPIPAEVIDDLDNDYELPSEETVAEE